MAQELSADTVWIRNTAGRDMRSLDVVALTTGKIGIAFGGSSGPSGVIYSTQYDLGTATLGPIRENLLPGNSSGGVPVTTVGEIDVVAGLGGNMIVTFQMANSAIGADGNSALLSQVYDGATPTGTATPVNPGTPLQITTDAFATLRKADGSYLTFHTEYPGGTNLSTGVVMTSFTANGAVIGTPRTVIVDRLVWAAGNVEANPEAPDATLMANGRVGLVYKENTATGAAVVMFQQMTDTGRLVGTPLQLATGAAVVMFQQITDTGRLVGTPIQLGAGALDPKIITLASGKMVAIWQSADAFGEGTIKAQILSAQGALSGAAFDIASADTGSEKLAEIVATGDGGFAVSWFSGNHPVARLFDDRGRALGNDFSLTDTSAKLDLYGTFGLTATDTGVVGFVSGSEIGKDGVLLGQVFGTASTLGRNRTGLESADTLNGGTLDDRLTGLGGADKLTGKDGNDILLGGDGADTISGGAGRDVITGGNGPDRLSGGGDADVFVFNASSEGADVITDFSQAQGDKIAVDNLGFGRELFPGFFLPLIGITLTNGATTDANAAGFFFNTTTKVLSYDIDGAGATARVDIATLTGVADLTVWDIYVS